MPGTKALAQVAKHSQTIAASLDGEAAIPFKVVFKPVLTTPEEVRGLCREANSSEKCIGLVLWMHTFSPAKMGIAGLTSLTKPFLHLHTQFNRELAWSSIAKILGSHMLEVCPSIAAGKSRTESVARE